jgi:hypothetical protein
LAGHGRGSPYLREALAKAASVEAKRRAEGILAQVERGLWSGDRLRALRAVQVLEYVGTPPARRLLAELAKGAPQDPLSQDAKAALARLGRGK